MVKAKSFGFVTVLYNSYAAAQGIVTHNENGILITPFNVEEYVKETKDLMISTDKLKQLAINRYEHITKFSYPEIYKKLDRTFKTMNE
jgi:hypothetical protein